jgi:hypothetical protein
MSKAEEVIKRFLEDLEKVDVRPRPKCQPKPEAQVLPWPKRLSEMELCRRQQIIDATWEGVQARKRELEEETARSCHVGPGDPDYWLR